VTSWYAIPHDLWQRLMAGKDKKGINAAFA
jgi:hypothetical protein